MLGLGLHISLISFPVDRAAEPSKEGSLSLYRRWLPGTSRECLNDAAFSDRAVTALADDAIELAAQCGEIRDFGVHLVQVLASNGIDGFA